MKVNELLHREKRRLQLRKIMRMMKCTIALMLLGCMHVYADGFSQSKISLRLQQADLKKALSLIEKQSSVRFLYNQDALKGAGKVSVQANNEALAKVLDEILAGSGITYKMLEDDLIVLNVDEFFEAADVKVTGKVTDSAGASVSGASVVVKGTKNGTATDASGNYTITVADDATLIFSGVGFNSFEEKVNGRGTINVTLQASERKLDEVVVIGYGTASKRDLTGSIAKVKGDVIAAQPNTNPLASLQGKVAGLSIVNDATPGSTPDVRIRGTVSIGTVRPVYIIDGIFSDNMDFVNPSEIESVEILKDPSSLAVFGIKGAAGAILVTTKKAKAGQVNINFNTSLGYKKLVDKIKLANGEEFRNLMTFEANNRVADDPTNSSLLNFVNNVGGPGLSAFVGNTDWIDAVTRSAMFNTNNLSIDGSTDKNRFHLGLGYTTDEGLVKHVKYERTTLNLSDEFKVSRVVKVGFNVIGTREKLPYESNALENARRALPIIDAGTKSYYMKNPYGLDSGNYNLYSTVPIIQNSESNPMATLENNWDKKKDERYRIVGSVFVDLNITKDLNFRSTWYGNMSWENNREYTPLYNLYDPSQEPGGQIIPKNSLTAVRQDLTNNKDFQQDYIATYKKRFGDHSFSATAGVTTFYHKYEQVSATVSQSTPGISVIPNNESFWYLNSGFGDKKSVIPTTQNEYSTVSGLARVLYNYQNKYYLNGSFRRDGSSQINQDYSKKFQNFWAVGAAWEISKEKFMENVGFINFLKLKGSTGLLGNFTAQGKDYPAYPTISSNASAVFGSNFVPVYVADYAYDPNLHWESVKSTEIGLETDMFSNRLHFEAAYYKKKTEDLLVLLNPPGQLPTLTNSGSIENSGFEFVASWSQNITKDLSFSVGGNLTTYKNKVLYLPFPLRPNISSSEQTPNQVETGFPIGYFYGLEVVGVYQSYTDILNSPVSTINGGNAKPGDLKYADLDGNDIINDKDRKVIGNPTPDFTYGISGTLKYKNLDLNVDFTGSYGNEVYRVWGTSEQKNSLYNYPQNYTEGWTAAGTSNWIPIVNQSHLINRAPSTYGIEDGSYIRVRNLSLGYTIVKLPAKAYVKNIRFSASAQNLKTWKHNEGYSPEFAGTATEFGLDFGAAKSALPRIITFGLNANF